MALTPDLCPPPQEVRPFELGFAPIAVSEAPGYVQKLATTDLGPPLLPRWCVWVEPATSATPSRWEERWHQGVDQSLKAWQQVLPITRVIDPQRAHVRIERRRPPRRQLAAGWRASNGRSLLKTLKVRRLGAWHLEPRVTVLVSPELRASVLQATALHELGHAFGLWGHSDDPGDAMAVSQGHQPVLQLSARDRLTLQWMQQQPTQFGQPVEADLAVQARLGADSVSEP